MASSILGKTCFVAGIAMILGTVAHALWGPKAPTEVRMELSGRGELFSDGEEERVRYTMTFYNDWPYPIRLVGTELC